MPDKLAIQGGPRTIDYTFKKYNSIGDLELTAATEVIQSGILSQFLGSHSEDFYGGQKVKQFEADCQDYFGVKHAITVNSWTSGLIAAIGALDINPGDEIIVPPWTMCATATAVLHWNAIPIFADIEPDTFNIDPISVSRNISSKTKAILAVDIFGHSADITALKKIADEHNLMLISDTAQSPRASYEGKHAGTLADIGGFSLNYHKHIHTGEGGIIVTNDSNLAERMYLIRNHAEAAVEGMGINNISNMVGYNFRLGEIECAMGIEQLKKLESFVLSRQNSAKKIIEGIKTLKGIKVPTIKNNCSHVFYILGLVLDLDILGTSRQKIFDALVAEGLQGLISGYANIHMLPIFQKKIAYGSKGFPWSADFSRQDVNYSKGICPVAEDLHDNTFLGYEMCLHDLSDDDINLIINAFHKVWSNLETLS